LKRKRKRLTVLVQPTERFSPSPQCLGKQVQKHRGRLESFSHPIDRIRLASHAYICSSQILRDQSVTGLTERSRKRWIVFCPSDVMLFDTTVSPAKKAAILIVSLREPPGRFNGVFVNHDDDSGKA
jgi:hypothetical protein